MSFNGRRPQKLITINELPDFEQASIGSRQSTPLLKSDVTYVAEPVKKTQVMNTDEEYAHSETQHTHLIGDVATADKQAISTLNWRETIRKRYGTQKFLRFKAPYQLNRRIMYWSQLKSKYTHTMPVIDPQSQFLTYWKIPVLFITILIFIEVPLVIFFSDDFYDTFRDPIYTLFRVLAIFVFLVDIFIEFHVAYYNHGALVKNRLRVAENYLWGMFFFDFIPVSVMILTSFSYYLANLYVFHLLFLLKMYPVYEMDQRFVDQLQVYPKWKSFYVVIRMIVEIIYLTHFFGCIFFGTAVYMLKKADNEGVNINSWLTFSAGNFGIIEKYDWSKRYVLSTYWAFATLTTVAYGDITPMNEFEIIVSEIAMVAALFLVAMNVANIQQTFVDYYDERRKYQREIIAITKFMRQKKVSRETEKEIKNYLEHYFKEKRNRDHYLEETVIEKLAPSLKSRLMFEAYQRYLYSVPWIKSNFSEDLIKALSQGVQEIDYSSKENIFLDKGFENQDDNSLFFVQIGHIEIFIDVPETKRHEVIVAHLKQGAHFGDFGFITGMQRKASARSKKYSQVVRLKRSTFLEILENYPSDHQRFCYLKDELIFNNAYYELGLQCYTCSSTDHMSVDCSLTHLNIGQDIIKQSRQSLKKRKSISQNQYQPQQRTPYYQRMERQCKNAIYKQMIKEEIQDQYYEKTQEKIKFEAFYSNNKVIIESFQVDKIENFFNYYPEFNFDALMNHSKDKSLIFALQGMQRQVSGIFRKSEILI